MNYFDCHCDTLTLMDPARDTLYSNSLFIDLKRVSAFADRYTQIYAIFDDVDENPVRNGVPGTVFHQCHMLRIAASAPVEEDPVSGLGDITIRRAPISPPRRTASRS